MLLNTYSRTVKKQLISKQFVQKKNNYSYRCSSVLHKLNLCNFESSKSCEHFQPVYYDYNYLLIYKNINSNEKTKGDFYEC